MQITLPASDVLLGRAGELRAAAGSRPPALAA
jgi:hypothetical protein